MRVLYLWDSDYPWDVRVEKICSSLMKNGHEVHVAARNLKRLPQYEKINGLHIHRLRARKSDKTNYAFSFPAFFNPVWKKFLDHIIFERKINLIIVRDLPMAIAGIWAGKRHKVPVIFDMAEDYVAMIRDIWRNRKFQGFNFVVRNPYMATLVEKYSFKKFDHILVVIDEAVKVAKRAGGKKDKVTIVGNTPYLDILNKTMGNLNEELNFIKNRYSAIYIGGIQRGRGIQTVFEAIPEIIKKIPEFLFVVVGDGYATPMLKNLIKGEILCKHVLWVGWVNHEKVYDYLKVSKIGLIPHFVTDHKNTTVPNKIFDYMGLGIPVVATDAIPLKRILNEEKCGITFRSEDSKDLADSILKIYNSSNDYGMNGQLAIKNKYNWNIDEKRLLDAVNKTIRCERSM